MARPHCAAVLVVAAALLQGACRPQADTPAALQGSDALPRIELDPVAVASGTDVNSLRMDSSGDRVLVTSGGRAFITVAQYNAWLGSYPLAITSQDPVTARREAVDQMITFELLAERARMSGGTGGPGTSSEKALVLTYIRDQMSDLSAVSDEQARAYLSAHAQSMAAIQATGLPDEVELAALKGAVLGERLAERIRGWRDEADLAYAPDSEPHAELGESP